MAEIDKKTLGKLLVGKRIVSVDTDWPNNDAECEKVKITTDDGSVVVFSVGKEMGEAFVWFSQEP